jgi:hypothetical protein
MVDEAGHNAGMSAQHEHKPYDDDPANCLAHGYRSRDADLIPLPAATGVATTTARCSLLARFAVALETRLIHATMLKLLRLVCPLRTAVMRARKGVTLGWRSPA